MELPKFKYHPDPLNTGSIIESDNECECCGKAMGFVYGGIPYCEDELDECVCPWCIASGAAARKFDAEFTDIESIGGFHDSQQIAEEIKIEVAQKTPGFSGWQQEKWWSHSLQRSSYA